MRPIMLCALAALLAGCQSYKPRPLDADRATDAWRARTNTLASLSADAYQPTSRPTTRPFDPSDGIDLVEAEIVALFYNANLRKARLDANVTTASADEAGRWEDPRISIDAERLLEADTDKWVLAGMLQVSLPISGRLDVEKTLATSEARAAAFEVMSREQSVILDLRIAWLEWSAAARRTRVLEEAISDLESISRATDSLKNAGEIDATDARLFAIDIVQRRSDLLDARRRAARRASEIIELMGLAPEANASLKLTGSLQIDLTGPIATAPAPNHPALLQAKAEYDVAERSLELEVRKQYPDIEIGGGLGREEGDPRLLAGISLPFPIWNANRRAIAEARARRDASQATYEAELQSLITRLSREQAEYAAAQAQADLVESDLIPLVDRQLTEVRRLLEAGEFNLLVLRDAIDAATSARLKRIDAQLALAQSAAAILDLTKPVITTTLPPETQP